VVIDVADPRNPAILGTVIVAGRNPRVSGNLVYLCGNSTQFLGRINVVDVSNPTQPTVIGGLDLPGWEWLGPVAISGNHGFVPVSKQNAGWDHDGVVKLELLPSPEAPRLLGITYTPGGIGGAAVSGTTLLACAGSSGGEDGGGIYLFNVADMSVIGAVDIQRAWNVLTAGGLVYVLSPTGLTILPDHCEGAPVSVEPEPGSQDLSGLGAAFPNPGRNSSTFIPFTVTKPGAVTLRIMDANGREVRSLVNETMGAGERRVEWDGLNARGERVPAGIYVYELRAPGLNAARKMVRLR
ncbi:MAG TPA: FlgD immunoglobulin-like domain containing protein, partial [Candidatus Eisenbacteria bacterium]|nr:FlgD immunoglobulin-like domain containing protein [Candidatus Eisenbacteria bacterium]